MNDTTNITVTPTANNPNATITINGISVASGNASNPINLNEGSNRIHMKVTAEDEDTIKAYSIQVTRLAPNYTYDVGPNQDYEKIGDVPWLWLGPGDIVRIHGKPTPYYEKFATNARGTHDHPIRIIGVKGPEDESPVISGENAIISAQFHNFFKTWYEEHEGRDVFMTLESHGLLIVSSKNRETTKPGILLKKQGDYIIF